MEGESWGKEGRGNDLTDDSGVSGKIIPRGQRQR